jgi:hypothetical protein
MWDRRARKASREPSGCVAVKLRRPVGESVTLLGKSDAGGVLNLT